MAKFNRFFHLKFKKWQFMNGFANFVPGAVRVPHWDAMFKMYGGRYEDWREDYGERFVLELNGKHTLVKSEASNIFSGDGYMVTIKDFGFLPDELEYTGNEPVAVVEYVNAMPLIGPERWAKLDDVEKAKLSNMEITHARDLLNAFLTTAKVGVREDGTFGYIGWTPWLDALGSLLGAHPVKSVDAPQYAHREGRTIKGANIELRVDSEVYRTADFYWHGDITSSDQIADPKTVGDYGGFTRCSAEEDYSFAMFHFEVVKPGIAGNE